MNLKIDGRRSEVWFLEGVIYLPSTPLGRVVLLIISVGGKNLHQSCAVLSIPGVIIP